MARPVLLVVGAAHRELAAIWSHKVPVAGVLIEQRGTATMLSTLWRRAKRQSPLRTLGQLSYRLARRLRRRSQPKPPATFGWLESDLDPPQFSENLPVQVVSDVNSSAAQSFVRGLDACATAVYGVSVIREPMLSLLPQPAINLHTGLTEHYRGLHSSLWALADGRPDLVGYTLHLLDSGLDTGAVVESQAVGESVVHKSPTLSWIDRHVALAGERRLLALMQQASRGEEIATRRLAKRGRLRSDPTWCQYRSVLRKWKLH